MPIYSAVSDCDYDFMFKIQQLKLVMDSIIWAFRHTERNIAETGLNLLLEMLKKFQVWSLFILFMAPTPIFQRFFLHSLFLFWRVFHPPPSCTLPLFLTLIDIFLEKINNSFVIMPLYPFFFF